MSLSPRGLRARLMLLMLAAALPAFAVIGGFIWWEQAHEGERRREDLLALARSLAEKHQENLDDARLLLGSLARLPEIRAADGPACGEAIAAIHALARPHVANLFVVRADGEVRCSARTLPKHFSVAGIPWFQDALAAKGFGVGGYHAGHRDATPTLTLTHTERAQGKVVAVLAASLDLSWLAAQPYPAGQPAALAYALYDRNGTLIQRQPVHQGSSRGTAAPLHWRALNALQQATVFGGSGGGAAQRLFAYAPLGPATRPYARLVVDVPLAAVNGSVRELALFGLIGLAAAMALGLLAGWFGSSILVARLLRPVLDTVQRVAGGDLSARTPPEPINDDEISRLAAEVDRMAEALSRRDDALTKALERAQAYLDVVGVMVLVLNSKGNITLANRKACEVLGCANPQQCVGGNWFDTWVPEDVREQARARFARSLDGMEAAAVFHEDHILTASGQRRLVAWHASPLADKAGRCIGMLCAGEDITEARQIQQDLLDSSNRYQALVENIPGVVYRCAITYPWRMVYISHPVEQLTGYAAERYLDQSVRHGELIHPDDLPAVKQAVAGGLAERRPYASAYRLRHASGAWRWVQERGRAMFDGTGHAIWLDGVIVDITEHKALLDEQERLQAQLQQAQKMEALGQLTGGIAHDFNNILASVLGFAKLALRRHAPDPEGELAEYLREVITAGERARDLVARMLTFSRAQPVRAARPLAPAPLLKEAVKMLAATIPTSIRIDTHIEAPVPEVAIDPVDLHQILVNLAINARDALDGRGRIVIGLGQKLAQQQVCDACREKFSGDYLELTVSDNGQGIAPEALPHIFEPFFTTKEVGKGTGMGLAMVHGLVRRAGGHFRVETTPGQGSTFHIYLPAAAALPQTDAVPPARPAATPGLGPKGHALVVDDEPAILRLLRASLEMAGWRVSAFNDPRQALAAFRDTPDEFTVAISDQTMPGMSGMELIHALHASHPHLPAVLCTGFSDGLDEAAFRRQGILGPLRKPVDADTLLATLAEVASRQDTLKKY